ncbi:MAG: hypothetical protein WCV67_09365 [Victivallaceae bacterium]|jgi:hypothetical protein
MVFNILKEILMAGYNHLTNWATNKYPIKVNVLCSMRERKPIVEVEIINKTSEVPVFIHSVRVHCGMEFFSRAFVLDPYDKIAISPKNRALWHLPYEGTCIS